MGKILLFTTQILLLISIITSCCPTAGGEEDENVYTPDHNWTVMVYLGGDNNLESDLLNNVAQMKNGYNKGLNLLVLIDRITSYSTDAAVLGEDFTGTRAYRIENGRTTRLYGDETFAELSEEVELNTATPKVLQKFIKYCKKNYPASHYGLIIGSHGEGSRSGAANKNVVLDKTDGNDWLYTAEFTDTLTVEESVNLLGLDACYMGNAEFVYQLSDKTKFHADYIVASPAEEQANGWCYKNILKRINSSATMITEETEYITGEKESIYSSKELTPECFSKIIVEEQYDYTSLSYNTKQTLSCYKTEYIYAVKNRLDELSVLLIDNSSDIISLRGNGILQQSNILHYFDSSSTSSWLNYPYFDLYDIALKISESQSLSDEIKTNAKGLMGAVDECIIYSFAGSNYNKAKINTTGLTIFFPDGSRLCQDKPMWAYQYTYNSIYIPEYFPGEYYGKLSFCIDGATPGNNKIENWFELLDLWYDIGTDYNHYKP